MASSAPNRSPAPSARSPGRWPLSTLTTVAVFLPIGLVGGQAGEIFRPFAVAAVVALLASLVVSLTVVPVFASWFMRPTAKQVSKLAAEHESEAKDSWLQKGYLPVLNWTLAHRWLTLLMALLVFAGTVALVPRLKTDFIGSMGTESLAIKQELPPGTGLNETDKAAAQIEALLAADPSVLTYSTSVGSGTSAALLSARSDTNEARFTVPLKPGSDATETADRLRQQIAELGSDVGEVEVSIGAGNSSSGVVVYVESSDPDQLEAANASVLTMMQGIPGLTNVTSDLAEARDMLAVNVNEGKAADQGMTQASIGQAVARAVQGQLMGTLAQGDTTLNVYLRSQAPVQNIDELRQIKLPVTQLQNANAKSDAADKVTARSDTVLSPIEAAAERRLQRPGRGIEEEPVAGSEGAGGADQAARSGQTAAVQPAEAAGRRHQGVLRSGDPAGHPRPRLLPHADLGVPDQPAVVGHGRSGGPVRAPPWSRPRRAWRASTSSWTPCRSSAPSPWTRRTPRRSWPRPERTRPRRPPTRCGSRTSPR